MKGIPAIFAALGCILICQLAGAVGALTTNTGSSLWYQSLNKPSFNPPGWVFGPVWTMLYALMGISLYLLLRNWPATRPAVALFALQLLLNAAWTPVFFGGHWIGLAMVVLVLMWVATVATVVMASWTTPLAAGLLLPYLAWITFAGVLNAAFWLRN